MPSVNRSTVGYRLASVILGIDGFVRAAPEKHGLTDGDGLVAINIADDLVEARRFSGFAEIEDALADLDRSAGTIASPVRSAFVHGMVRSLRTALRYYAGEPVSFAERVSLHVGTQPGVVDPEFIEERRDTLDGLLRSAGIVRGTLADRVHEWESRGFLDDASLLATYNDLQAKAKLRTAERIFDTGDYEMALNPVRNVFFTARCGFKRRLMDLNVDNKFTRPAVKHLVCHEIFPGHSTQLLSCRAAVEAGRSEPDALLCATYAITGPFQEGIGDQAVHLIDWIEDDDDRIHGELRRLRSAAQTTAVWRLMNDNADEDEVKTYLGDIAFGQKAWIDGRVRMARNAYRGPFIPGYFHGNEAVAKTRARFGDDHWPALRTLLFETVQSPESLSHASPLTA